MTRNIDSSNIKNIAPELTAGDQVLLSGVVYTARDAAHKRIFECIESGAPLPFDINGAAIYYAGPTPTMPGRAIGSCGPTTSSRMDFYAPRLYDMGLAATIGKGPRSQEVVESIVRNGSVYFAALGGIGALASRRIVSCEVIAYDDLGCESVKKLVFHDFPLYVAIDSHGHTIFS